jgi:hypothetical protein
MPRVRKDQTNSDQARMVAVQEASSLPVSSAATAMAKGTAMPT